MYLLATLDSQSVVASINAVQLDDRGGIDRKKLDKADLKIKQKQEKRSTKQVTASQTVKAKTASTPTVNQASFKAKFAEGETPAKSDIRIENFDIAFGDKVLLQNADLLVSSGRRYGLVGRNGLGKSTLLCALSSRQLVLPPHVTIFHVEQEVEGSETMALQSVLECYAERELLLKKEKDLLKSGNDADLAQVYSRLQEIDADNAPSVASCILRGLGFSQEMQSQPTREFSGGWRMRLALARALFMKPDLLLLDEPTNMLDMGAILWLEKYLQNWPKTLLVVSHDRCFLDAVVTDVIYLHSHRLEAFKGNYSTFEKTRNDRLKCQQREYEAQQQHKQHLQDFVDRWRYNAKRSSLAQSRLKAIEKLPDLKPVIIEPEVVLRFPEVEKLNPPIIQLDSVSFAYPKGSSVYKDIDLSVSQESRIALLGENGSGKTTLLKLLMGVLEPTSGLKHAHRKIKFGYFAQHHVDQLVMGTSPLEFLQSRYPGRSIEDYRAHLGSYGITGELALRPITSLSGGQKSRLAFSLMTVTSPNVLILDEPTNHLDIETVEALGKALQKYNGGVIIASHDESLITKVCNEVWLCGNGNIQKLEGIEYYKKLLEDNSAL
jgi:ATP-binding cassette subfamily F protein 3